MLIFYLLNIWTIKFTFKMIDFMLTVRENQIISQSILVNRQITNADPAASSAESRELER